MDFHSLTAPEGPDGPEEQFGLGVRIVPAERLVQMLFEVRATGSNGKTGYGGISVRLEKCKTLPTIPEAEARAAAMARNGIEVPGFKRRLQATPLTWEKYQAKGYDK